MGHYIKVLWNCKVVYKKILVKYYDQQTTSVAETEWELNLKLQLTLMKNTSSQGNG